jgi:hypothetical protein
VLLEAPPALLEAPPLPLDEPPLALVLAPVPEDVPALLVEPPVVGLPPALEPPEPGPPPSPPAIAAPLSEPHALSTNAPTKLQCGR